MSARGYVCGFAFRNSFIACAIVWPAVCALISFALSLFIVGLTVSE